MEDKFYKDEFEQFLQQQANNHRMYPSDGVWLGIYKKLHGDKKWPGLTIAAFAFLIATIAISVYFSPKPSIFELTAGSPAQHADAPRITPATTTPLINSINNNYHSTKGKDIVTKVGEPSGSLAVAEPRPISVDIALALNDTKANSNSINDLAVVALPHRLSNFLRESARLPAKKTLIKEDESLPEVESYELPDDNLTATASPADGSDRKKVKSDTLAKKIEKDRDDKNMADNFLKQHGGDIALYTTDRKANQKKKFSYTVYIAPSISYRKLKEDQMLNKKSNNINGPVALNYVADVNKVVRHKPGTGIEAGFGITYHVTNTFGIKTGLQFNVRQYNIEAFKSPFEAATIALMSNNGIDTINTYAVYRNNNGYLSTELVNRYYQVAVPIGLEWEVIGSKKVKFNVAASVQPTYTMNKNSYLLSSNFKNYTATSGMLRNWNINTSVEAYMSIKVGEYKWQLGPQFRYQHLPTLISEYPIHEHLMDYGFKIGVSKLIK